MCDRSFRLNPTPPDWYYSDCVTNLYFTGRYQEAIEAVNRGAASTEPTPSMLVWKAASQAELGQADAAKKTIADLQKPLLGGLVRVAAQYGLEFRAGAGAGPDPGVVEEGGTEDLRDRRRAGGFRRAEEAEGV